MRKVILAKFLFVGTIFLLSSVCFSRNQRSSAYQPTVHCRISQSGLKMCQRKHFDAFTSELYKINCVFSVFSFMCYFLSFHFSIGKNTAKYFMGAFWERSNMPTKRDISNRFTDDIFLFCSIWNSNSFSIPLDYCKCYGHVLETVNR